MRTSNAFNINHFQNQQLNEPPKINIMSKNNLNKLTMGSHSMLDRVNIPEPKTLIFLSKRDCRYYK
jgi:hypothetical protein